MSAFSHPEQSEKPYRDPTPLPAEARVPELGATSAPLKSAAFFIGAYCKDYNGTFIVAHFLCQMADHRRPFSTEYMLTMLFVFTRRLHALQG